MSNELYKIVVEVYSKDLKRNVTISPRFTTNYKKASRIIDELKDFYKYECESADFKSYTIYKYTLEKII